jgi:hypothetical protein
MAMGKLSRLKNKNPLVRPDKGVGENALEKDRLTFFGSDLEVVEIGGL